MLQSKRRSWMLRSSYGIFILDYSHHELEMSSGSKLPGYLALFSQMIQIIMMTNFLRGYFVAMKNSTPMTLPTNNLAVDMV